LAAQDDAIDVDCRTPSDVPVANRVNADRPRVEAIADAAFLRPTPAAASAAADARDRNDGGSSYIDGIAENPANGESFLGGA
jgi:hypothetical protein